MTTLNSALNYNFASAEATRLAYAERGAEEVVASQLKQAATESKFTVGATITARYQYKVGEDGALVPVSTQITTDAPDDALRSNSRRQRQSARQEERQPTLKDLANPRAELSPTDEVALFSQAEEVNAPVTLVPSADADPLQQDISSIPAVAVAEVSDENGNPVQAEILTKAGHANPAENQRLRFSPAAQFSVASLYARTNDVVYNAVTPIGAFAA